MRFIALDEYIKDLTTYLTQYIKSSKVLLSKKAIDTLSVDRDDLYSLGVIHNNDGKLYNDSKLFLKIALATSKEAARGFFTYIDEKNLVIHSDMIYFEPYHSQITFELDEKGRSHIARLVYDFSFQPYNPYKKKLNVKINKELYEYNLNIAYIQFKAIWTSIYSASIPTYQATKLFDQVVQGEPVNQDFDNNHLTMYSNDSINLRSKTGEYGEFTFKLELEFPHPIEVQEELTPEQLYYKSLTS